MYGSNIDLTKTASKEGYTFIGWNTDSDATIGLSSIVMNTAGKTIYAIYQKTITATYNSNGSTLSKVSDSCTIYNNTTSCTFTSPTITRANYTIIGFNTNSTATTSTLNVETIYEISNDTTYYAITRDAKQPSISLGSNSETTYTKSKSVIVTVSDGESGLATSQGIKYGWSTSNTTAPSSYTNVVLSNTNAASSTTFTASSTDTLTGQYYLWIVPNTSVCDVIGNCNTTTVKSTGLFYFDNTSPSCSISASSSDDTINMSIASTDAQSGLATSNGYGYKYGSQSSYTMSSNSTYSFSGLQSGTYTVYGYVVDKLGNYNTCSTSVTVTLAITYARLSASYSCANASAGSSPYIMSYTGNCSIISDGGTNWRVKLLSGGNLSFSSNFSIDLFLVGGGGGAGSNVTHGGGGGAGGKTLTVKKVAVTSASSPYTIVIGSGGAARTTGGTSSGFTYSIAGGGGGTNGSSSVGGSGGTGGSGGGGGGHNGSGGYGGAGGSYGNSGSDGGRENGVAGSGQGSTTCEFGEGTTSACTNGTNYLYSAGGGGGGGYHTSGFLSSGSNGAGLSGSNSGAGGQAPNGTGSSGIVIIRNAR